LCVGCERSESEGWSINLIHRFEQRLNLRIGQRNFSGTTPQPANANAAINSIAANCLNLAVIASNSLKEGVLLEMHWQLKVRVLWLTTGCASARDRVSKTPLTPGSTEAACQIVNPKS
jgi:hypothetical protein